MKLVDLHSHSSGISKCCQIDGKQVVEVAKKVGIDAIVLTNHYQKSYIENNGVKEFSSKYVKEYFYTKEEGKKIGVDVYFGIEVTLDKHNDAHVLIYGVDPSFVLNYPDLYSYPQEELYLLVKKHNAILIQAHPFRNNINKLLDLSYLDGIEVNCHPLYEGTHFEEIISIAKLNNKIVTCGGDYHADTHRPKCGVYLPKNITDSIDIKNYLLNTDSIQLCVQEVDSQNSYIFIYGYDKIK